MFNRFKNKKFLITLSASLFLLIGGFFIIDSSLYSADSRSNQPLIVSVTPSKTSVQPGEKVDYVISVKNNNRSFLSRALSRRITIKGTLADGTKEGKKISTAMFFYSVRKTYSKKYTVTFSANPGIGYNTSDIAVSYVVRRNLLSRRMTRVTCVISIILPTAKEPILPVPQPGKSVKDFGAKGDGVTDDTKAIQDAVTKTGEVNFPVGNYNISDAINLGSNVHILGAGNGSIIKQTTSDKNIFQAKGDSQNFVSNITVEKLAFEGVGKGIALNVTTGKDIIFRNNTSNNIALFNSALHYPIQLWDKTKDPAATAGLVNEGQLNSNLRVTDNIGTCSVSQAPACGAAISLHYSNHSKISGNKVNGFLHGIVWWGGDANPSRGGGIVWVDPNDKEQKKVPINNPRWAKDIQIESNEVKNSVGGIWGSMGQNITVSLNYVEKCNDVCLDAEGSKDVTFTDNTAKSAANGVLATFHFSSNILFTKNNIIQDKSLFDASKGYYMYRHYNSTGVVGDISVTLQNNSFNYIGASGTGIIAKDALKILTVKENTLNNVILSFDGNNSCSSEVLSNKMTLTGKAENSTGALPAILINKIWPDGNSAQCSAKVENNTIENTNAQNLEGISIAETGFNNTAESTISGNKVRGFEKSIIISGNSKNGGIIGKFSVINNIVSGRIIDLSPDGRSKNDFSGNVNFSGTAVNPQ